METIFQTTAAHIADERTFLRKTYFNLIGAIAAFIGVEAIFFITGIAQALAPIMLSNWLVVIGGFMLLGWVTNYFTSKGGSIASQYMQMAVTITLQAFIFIPLLAYAIYFSDISVLTSAITVSLIIFTAMTAIVVYSGKNFSFLGPFLAVIGIGVLLCIIGAVLFSVSLGFYFAVAMVVFASAVILYETSKVVHEYGEGQYVAAATGLFASVALLFYYVLSAFVSRN